jgi:hypothetical protein
MGKEFDVSYVCSSWYDSRRIKLSDKEYDKAIQEDNLEEVLSELYWEENPEINEITKPEYFIEETLE